VGDVRGKYFDLKQSLNLEFYEIDKEKTINLFGPKKFNLWGLPNKLLLKCGDIFCLTFSILGTCPD